MPRLAAIVVTSILWLVMLSASQGETHHVRIEDNSFNPASIIIAPGDIDALAAAIQHLYDHPEIVERMSVAARKRAVENFTWDHFRARLLDAYELAMRVVK